MPLSRMTSTSFCTSSERRATMDRKSQKLFAAHFSHCEVKEEKHDGTSDGRDYLMISPIWKGVDRPDVSGYSVPITPIGARLAKRLKRCIESGAAFSKVDLPLANEIHHRTFWKDITDVAHYHAWLRLGNLKLAVNRRPWLRRILLPLVSAARSYRARKDASRQVKQNN